MQFLLDTDIDKSEISDSIGILLAKGVDYADIYFQNKFLERWVLEDGIVSDASFDVDSGFGVRAIVGDNTSYCYSNDISKKSLQNSCKIVLEMAKTTKKSSSFKLKNNLACDNSYYKSNNIVTDFANENKVKLLQFVNQQAYMKQPDIFKLSASIVSSFEEVMIANSDGFIYDYRPLIRFNVNVTLKSGDRIESAISGGGGRFSYDRLDNDFLTKHIDKAIANAKIKLEAREAIAGEFPLVLGPGWPGILLHEAIGHGLEADANRKKSSNFHDKLNTKVSNDLCSIVDNGTLEERRGSLHYDDEGTKTKSNLLVENGKLVGYMQDKLNSSIMKMPLTGNGRRESYAYAPIPRMTNTYMLPKDHLPEDIIKSVKYGIYAVDFGGGQVDTSSGKFVFNATHAYMIENGKLTYPIKGATLIGDGLSILKKISMVGHDLKFDEGVGTCGKSGQSVPVGVGMPTVKVDNITIGGTQKK